MLELLQELSLLPGVSGREDLVRERIEIGRAHV